MWNMHFLRITIHVVHIVQVVNLEIISAQLMDPILIIVPVIRYEGLSESKNKIKNQFSLK